MLLTFSSSTRRSPTRCCCAASALRAPTSCARPPLAHPRAQKSSGGFGSLSRTIWPFKRPEPATRVSGGFLGHRPVDAAVLAQQALAQQALAEQALGACDDLSQGGEVTRAIGAIGYPVVDGEADRAAEAHPKGS
jgi:hypothetical protein